MPTRTPIHSERRFLKASREQILDAARALFLEHGLEGLSMRRVARRVGVTPTALYRHYDNKEALVAAVFLDGVEVFSRYMLQSLEGDTPQERLRLTSEAFLRFGLEQPRQFEVFFLKRLEGIDDEASARFAARRAATFQLLLDRVRENLAAGAIRPVGSAYTLAILLLSTAQGAVSLHLAGQLDLDRAGFERLYRETWSALLAGLSP